MAFIDFGKREIRFKVVYYGPGRSGKTTNLEQIHAAVTPESRGELTMISTSQERTLFFDFLPLESNIIKGFVSRFQLYTVPGQVMYNQTRKLVLVGADAVVFVADSQWSQMEENVESLDNLAENIAAHGFSLETMPFILQYNKRDLPEIAPVEYLRYLLNRGDTSVPENEATASSGKGVFESLNLICRMALLDYSRKHGLKTHATSGNICLEKEARRNESCSMV